MKFLLKGPPREQDFGRLPSSGRRLNQHSPFPFFLEQGEFQGGLAIKNAAYGPGRLDFENWSHLVLSLFRGACNQPPRHGLGDVLGSPSISEGGLVLLRNITTARLSYLFSLLCLCLIFLWVFIVLLSNQQTVQGAFDKKKSTSSSATRPHQFLRFPTCQKAVRRDWAENRPWQTAGPQKGNSSGSVSVVL